MGNFIKFNRIVLVAGVAFLLFGYVPSGFGAEVSSLTGNYVVQLNAFTIEANAHNFIRKLRAKDYPVFLDHKAGDRWFKVRVGPYANWEEAREISRDLKKNEKLSPLVLLKLGESEKTVKSSGPSKQIEVETPVVETPNAVDNLEVSEVPEAEVKNESDSVDRVIARFMEWKTAWQEKDLPAYLQFYSSNFDSGRKSPEAWERSRTKALSRDGGILVDVAEVQIQPSKGKVEMSFIQKFKSSKFSDVGHKTMVWHLEGGHWKIVSERWLPI